MRKSVISVCAVIFLITAALSFRIIYNLNHKEKQLLTDRTTNVNVMLNRAKNWKKIIDKPFITEQNMYMIDGSTATIPITAEILRQFFNYSDDKVNNSSFVFHSTTHNAYELLINKDKMYFSDTKYLTKDLIFVTPPSDEELQLAKNKNVELDIKPIAKDGFVFITHKDNPVDSLTVEQIQNIYTGKITNWKQVGGEDLKINTFQREKNSGSQTAMEQMVMQGKKMIKALQTKYYMGMGDLVKAVAEYQNGKASIGYTYNYYINNLYKNENIKVIKINGITPENKNLINKSYPFTTNYYAVMRNDEKQNSPARKLRDFLLTQKGQDLIEMAGYCRSEAK